MAHLRPVLQDVCEPYTSNTGGDESAGEDEHLRVPDSTPSQNRQLIVRRFVGWF